MRTLLFTLLSLLLPISLVEAQNATGVYNTDFNEMTIQRNGNKVTGTYKWNNGRIEGTISGHTLANGVATMPHRQGSGTAKELVAHQHQHQQLFR